MRGVRGGWGNSERLGTIKERHTREGARGKRGVGEQRGTWHNEEEAHKRGGEGKEGGGGTARDLAQLKRGSREKGRDKQGAGGAETI